jgi:hypothetical protein
MSFPDTSYEEKNVKADGREDVYYIRVVLSLPLNILLLYYLI